ncbi:hypothetical protein B296_00046104 [Ensete ventricosum]|uniref:Uncharacterized protein n=1 Tax=Ensete ventricosum TaxID=4639 RepID=A0A426XMM9_ENSVE|nr:hypothetical protein B296_00046104 [Ensete ventricosum]
MTSDSSSDIRVVPSPESGGTSLGEPETSSSGASSGPPSPIDARVLRDLEVMKASHDLDTAVTEGSLAATPSRNGTTSRSSMGCMFRNPGSVPIGVDRMDLDDLCKMPKVSKGKLPASCATASAEDVGGIPPKETPKSSSKRPYDASIQQADDLARRCWVDGPDSAHNGL